MKLDVYNKNHQKSLRLIEIGIKVKVLFSGNLVRCEKKEQCVLGLPSTKIHSYLFSHQNIHFSQVTMRFLTPTHIHISLTLFNQKTPPKNKYTRKQPICF